MAMIIDAGFAAYEVFQVAFDGLDTRLSRCLLKLRGRKDAKLTFAVLKKKTFGHRLTMLQEALSDFNDVSCLALEIEELARARQLAQDVSKWRNDRVHGEVRFIENQPVLLDEAGKPLQIDRQACEERIREAIRAGIAMEASIPQLVAYEMDLEILMD
jgi:hypothetical protein